MKNEITILQKILEGDLNLIDSFDIQKTAEYNNKVFVYPDNVKTILDKYLSGNLSRENIHKWANFISLRVEYCCPEDDNFDDDYFDEMWDVINNLSSPDVFGTIDQELIKSYIINLDKY